MTILYRLLLGMYARSQGPSRRCLRILLEAIRRLLMVLGDPACRVLIHGKELLLPVSHKLPIYVADYAYYDTLPARIASYLRERDGFLSMVDVGANVGDTIVACQAEEDDRFLAVEANPSFLKYLRRNTVRLKHFALVEAFCGSGSADIANVRIESSGGTARVVEQANGLILPRRTLDEVFAQYPHFLPVNFLKIDTDGSDFDVLRSGSMSIAREKPVVLFECDMFGNENYADDFARAISFFATAGGYATAIVYDNLGHLFEVFELDRFSPFKYSLLYQLISRFGYFDVLILRSGDFPGFLDGEIAFFVEGIAEPAWQSAARAALNW